MEQEYKNALAIRILALKTYRPDNIVDSHCLANFDLCRYPAK